MQKHDSAYKYLFSNKTIFTELIRSFVKEDFVKDIDFNNIELVDKSFVTEAFLKRESDIIYKLKIKEDEAYIYILLEFQSKPDKSIPIRILLYLMQFYDLIFRNSQKRQLPNVFPLMLYNGFEDWNIPVNIRDLIDDRIPVKYIPSFEYYKIIIKDIPDEVLLKLKNLISAVMYLEKKRDSSGIKYSIEKIVDLIKKENIIDIRMFQVWLNRMFEGKIKEEDIAKIKDIKEVKSMLTTLVENIRQEEFEKGIEKGIKKGIEKGIEKGMEKGKKENAKKMLKKGFDVKLVSEITGLSLEEIEKL